MFYKHQILRLSFSNILISNAHFSPNRKYYKQKIDVDLITRFMNYGDWMLFYNVLR